MTTLFLDADDTLWENNIRFERVVADYLDWVDHPTLDRNRVREILNDIERANSDVHGYGTAVFLRSLHDCFVHLMQRPVSEIEAAQLHALSASLHDHTVDLMPGVSDVLEYLGERYDLRLLTKGRVEDQHAKLDASGLLPLFDSVHIVPEKNRDTYLRLTAEFGLEPTRTWMIGNSPRSDINPARAAGWRAVYIPNPHTWVLEHDEIDETDDCVITVESFAGLLDLF